MYVGIAGSQADVAGGIGSVVPVHDVHSRGVRIASRGVGPGELLSVRLGGSRIQFCSGGGEPGLSVDQAGLDLLSGAVEAVEVSGVSGEHRPFVLVEFFENTGVLQ